MSIKDKVDKMIERMMKGEQVTAEEMIDESVKQGDDPREFAATFAAEIVKVFLDQMEEMGYKYYLVAHHDDTDSFVIAGDISSKILGEGMAKNPQSLLMAKMAIDYATHIQAQKGIYTNPKGGTA